MFAFVCSICALYFVLSRVFPISWLIDSSFEGNSLLFAFLSSYRLFFWISIFFSSKVRFGDTKFVFFDRMCELIPSDCVVLTVDSLKGAEPGFD